MPNYDPMELLKRHEGWTDEDYAQEYGQTADYMKEQDDRTREAAKKTPEQREESRMVAIEEQQVEKKHRETRVEKFRKYADHQIIQAQFKKLLGGNDKVAGRYVESVVIAVAANEKLQVCSAKSIMLAALQAASLGISVDPAMQQAYLVPYGDEVKLIPDYRALVQMCANTNYYRYAPDANAVYEGEIVEKNRLTGEITISGKKISDVVIGWLTYSEAKNGVKRWLYMTNEECDRHGELYNPAGYKNPKSAWNAHNGRDRDKMRRKTCLRTFTRKYGNFSPVQEQFFYSDEPVIDAENLIDLPSEDVVEIEEKPELSSEERKARIDKNLTELGAKK